MLNLAFWFYTFTQGALHIYTGGGVNEILTYTGGGLNEILGRYEVPAPLGRYRVEKRPG